MTGRHDSTPDSSGYTDDLPAEIQASGLTFPQSRFENITPIYVSRSGSAQLLSATRYGKRFILKCLKEDFRYNPVYRTALLKEFEIGLSLDHPNIRSTIGFEEIEGYGAAIILEYVDGDTLENMLSGKEFTPQRALNILSQIAGALEYLHSKQVIHRDLKPANILVTYSGDVVKLIDFSLSDSDVFTVIKIPAGTRSYMAPEQLAEGAKANVRTDIFSFGTIMREMADLTGDRNLECIAAKCTQTDPDKRPYSMREIHIPSHPGGNSFLSGWSFSSVKTTRILLILTLLSGIWLAFALYLRNGATSNLPDSAVADDTSGEITIMDTRLWPD